MIPGNLDPRRPDKVQKYKPPAPGNGNAPGEDLTPDYMNILGPESTTGNMQGDNVSESIKNTEAKVASNQQTSQQQQQKVHDDTSKTKSESATARTSNASNVIPTSPQYGVAIIPTTSASSNDIPIEGATPATDTLTDTTAKTETEMKDMHSTPSKNDRFKVVKIASSEPFRRGRWKCMDYVDQTPPTTTQQTKTTTQGTTGGVQLAGNVYLQTQSLPPQQIQQLLMQGGFTTAPQQFFQTNLQSQLIPQGQYFYPAVQNQGNMQPQVINPGVVPANSVQPQFINPAQQATAYFTPAVLPQNFQNLQFIQQAAYQGQGSAFVPTTQNLQNFQQAQTYAGQPTVTQQNVQSQNQTIPATQPQPMVNGFAYSPQNVSEQQITASNLPTQVAKNVILSATSVVQNPVVQNQSSVPVQNQESQQNSVSAPQTVPIQNQIPEQNSNYQQQAQSSQQHPSQMQQQMPAQVPIQNVVVLQAIDPNKPTDVYTNPQFVASVHSLPSMESGDVQAGEGATNGSIDGSVGNPDDLSKTNPVVNAIDNKIEQAMDLVKSHLMYTVREEVEVLKEKIAELMERIQQLESENNFLRSQIPKNNPTSNGTSEPSPQQ